MIKRDWSKVEASQDATYKKLVPGGYVCKIVDVEDCPKGFNPDSPDKGDYLKVSFDIAEGEFEGYFAESAEKFGNWPYAGIYYASYSDKAMGLFKRFIQALEDSNRRFEWNDRVESDLKRNLSGLEFGIVMSEREHNGKINLRANSVYSTNQIDKGEFKVPGKKTSGASFEQLQQAITDLNNEDDTDLPF